MTCGKSMRYQDKKKVRQGTRKAFFTDSAENPSEINPVSPFSTTYVVKAEILQPVFEKTRMLILNPDHSCGL